MSRTISLLEIVQEAKPGADGVESGAAPDDSETELASDDPALAEDLADVKDELGENSTDVSTWPTMVLQN